MDNSQIAGSTVVLAFLSALTLVLDIPPLLWHVRNRNVAAMSLVLWIIVLNMMTVVNIMIWPTSDFASWWSGVGLCDVEAKLMVASTIALPASSMCIMRDLARVMDTEHSVISSTRSERKRKLVMDLCWCLGTPILLMVLHYVVQPNRYYVWAVAGCNPSIDNSWVAIVLILLPPLLMFVAIAGYTVLLLYRLIRYRVAFNSMMSLNSTTKSRFSRLFLISLTILLGFVPLQMYVFYRNIIYPHLPYSWSAVHDPYAWSQIVVVPASIFDRWARTVAGILVFLYFGLGKDAVGMYKTWLLATGLKEIFPRLNLRSSPGTLKSSITTLGSKAKLFRWRKTSGSTVNTNSL
ncbi:a-factor receptor [Elasticomyces elasticus]|nr:a-factor receptor [Elasticomyces elasticus]